MRSRSFLPYQGTRRVPEPAAFSVLNLFCIWDAPGSMTNQAVMALGAARPIAIQITVRYSIHHRRGQGCDADRHPQTHHHYGREERGPVAPILRHDREKREAAGCNKGSNCKRKLRSVPYNQATFPARQSKHDRNKREERRSCLSGCVVLGHRARRCYPPSSLPCSRTQSRVRSVAGHNPREPLLHAPL